MGVRQLTLAGDVAALRGARLVSGVVPGVVPGGGRNGYELSGRQRAADGAGRLLGRGLAFKWSSRSGDLRGGDGDDAAGVEFLQLPHQVVLPGIGGFAAGVEVGAQVGVGRAGLQDVVGDLEQGVGDLGGLGSSRSGYFHRLTARPLSTGLPRPVRPAGRFVSTMGFG